MTTYPAQLRVLDFGREVMNFPSLEQANATAPAWFQVSANATLTEVGATASVSDETYGTRALKVVTTATAAYAAQRHTYADQPRVKSGRTAFIQVAVWAVGGVAARVRLQSSAGSLGVSADTTAAAWTILTVPQVTLNGTYVEPRFEVDNGTAYFIPLTPAPRGTIFKWRDPATVKTLTGIQDENTWTDIDCTSSTSNLACMALLQGFLFDTVDDFKLFFRRNGSSQAANDLSLQTMALGASQGDFGFFQTVTILDDSQIFEYLLDRTGGATPLDAGLVNLTGFWEWE